MIPCENGKILAYFILYFVLMEPLHYMCCEISLMIRFGIRSWSNELH